MPPQDGTGIEAADRAYAMSVRAVIVTGYALSTGASASGVFRRSKASTMRTRRDRKAPEMETQPSSLRPPGFVVSLCSIAAGLVGFGAPVIGMIASFAGIGLGVWGFRQGRAAHYTPSVTCGLIGITVSVLGIVFWVCVILFESYH
jgi:hypothetical protein